MHKQKQAFSFVELIIAISVIVLLAVISLNSTMDYSENRDNSKVVSDVSTINNALKAYSNENSDLPMPKGNNNFFKSDSSYAHAYDSSDTYGVHGFVTNGTLPAKYMNFVPLDPRTNAFYAYGKTKSDLHKSVGNQYEIASVILSNGEPISKVTGNYTAEIGPFNLIREYNGPDFVSDKSNINFPYNPDELLLTAKITTSSGVVKINGSESNLNKTLVEGDNIIVSTGSYAEIYFSDGSISTLGDSTKESELTLSRLVHKKEDNLLTDIKIALSAGTIWTKATKLSSESEFEIYTTDTSAAVRGTIFGVEKGTNISNVTVLAGKVEVREISNETKESLLEKLGSDITQIEKHDIVDNAGVIENNIIEVIEGSDAKGVSIIKSADDLSSTGTISEGTGSLSVIPEEVKGVILGLEGNISNNVGPEIESFEGEIDKWEIKIKLNNTFKKADFIEVKYENSDGTESPVILRKRNDWHENDSLILKDDTEFTYKVQDGVESELTPIVIPTAAKEIKLAFGQNKKNGKVRLSRFKTVHIGANISYTDDEDDDSVCSTFEIAGEGCITSDSGLTASGFTLYGYAPYNTAGDLEMYWDNGSGIGGAMTDEYGNSIMSQNAILENSVSLPEECGNSGINKSSSFCIDADGNKGVFIDNIGSGEFLKYSDLDLSGNFAIEMGVKGLNRDTISSGNYTLFQIGNNRLFMHEGVLKFGDSSVLTGSLLNSSNSFDTIIFKIRDDNYIEVILNENKIIEGDLGDVDLDNIKIGNRYNRGYKDQWNDIIDYIKIYI